jgi:hypothetical protein
MIGPVLSGQVASERPADKGKPSSTGFNLYFGDLHTHTGYSDAYDESTPWDAYQAAVDAGADFMAITDHVQIWNAYDSFVMNETEWQDTLEAAESFTSKDFVAMAGYETWLLANCGEVNVYNIGELPPTHTLGNRFDRLPDFYYWLSQQPGAIGMFNHPLYVSENFMDYAYWDETNDIGMSIIEAYNAEDYEASYKMALDAGWHVMPSANSDTHYSDWIAGHEMRTVLLAESRTPEDLYAAMSACRGYGTLDKNLEIRYTLNGAVMGSVLSPTETTYTASIQIFDPDGLKDEITLIEIVSDKGVVSVPVSGDSVDITVTLSSEDARYFYLRVTTASPLEGDPGVTAWTAPVWTGW